MVCCTTSCDKGIIIGSVGIRVTSAVDHLDRLDFLASKSNSASTLDVATAMPVASVAVVALFGITAGAAPHLFLRFLTVLSASPLSAASSMAALSLALVVAESNSAASNFSSAHTSTSKPDSLLSVTFRYNFFRIFKCPHDSKSCQKDGNVPYFSLTITVDAELYHDFIKG